MKKAKLHTGEILVFDDDTSNQVIQDTVRRTLKRQGEPYLAPTIEQQTEILTNLATATQQLAERSKIENFSSTVEKQTKNLSNLVDITKKMVDKKDVDYFGPAIKKQTEQFEKVNKNLVDTLKSFIKDFVSTHSPQSTVGIEKVIEKAPKELSKQLAALTYKSDENTAGLMKVIMANTESINSLVAAQKENTDVLKQLVEATKAPKTVLRDKSGKIKGVK